MNFKLLLLLVSVLSLASCASPGDYAPEPKWRQVDVEAPTSRLLFRVALSELGQRGYPINNDLDPGRGRVISGWKTNLQPFSKQGWREKITLTITAKEKGVWTVRAHAERQLNMALVNPLDPSRAEWEWVPDNPLSADILLQSIQSTMNSPIEFGTSPAKQNNLKL
jgi:hypothetical protein